MLYKLLNLLFKQLTTIAHKLTVKAYNKEKLMAGKRVEYLKKVNMKYRELMIKNQNERQMLEDYYREQLMGSINRCIL